MLSVKVEKIDEDQWLWVILFWGGVGVSMVKQAEPVRSIKLYLFLLYSI